MESHDHAGLPGTTTRHRAKPVALVLETLDPAVTTLAFLGGAVATAALLRWMTQLGGDTDQRLADSAAFGAWIGIASLAVVLFVDTAIAGLREVHHLDRTLTRHTTGRYARWYVVFAGLAVAVLLQVGKGGPAVPVDAWPAISRGLLMFGAVAAAPWVVLVWSSHDLLARERELLTATSEAARARVKLRTGPAGAVVHSVLDEELRSDLDARLVVLLAVRRLIASAVTRLVGLVLAAILMAGALRAALVPGILEDREFPASAVVVYGAFFAVCLSAAVLPLMFVWRRAATHLLDSAYPPGVAAPAERAEARGRLSTVLDVDGSLFRSPIAVSSILAPLATSLLAAFVPQLSK